MAGSARRRAGESSLEIERKSKGERTIERILDAAEALFADRGYEATSLREIARGAGIQQPGLYNYFESKQALYAAVLDRALIPMTEAMQSQRSELPSLEAHATLASVMTDILAEHPAMAALFHHALLGEATSLGNRLILDWLDRLFAQAIQTLEELAPAPVDRADLAIQTIALFNSTTGYFLSQRLFEKMVGGDVTAPEHIARQKRLLDQIVRATMPG